MPSTVPRRVAAGAMSRMSRAPTITRERMSRPTRSVPNQWSEEGAARSSSGSVANGSSGASVSPKIAKMMNTPRIATPMRNVVERFRSARRSFCAARSSSLTGAVGAVGRPASMDGDAHGSLPSRTRGLSTE